MSKSLSDQLVENAIKEAFANQPYDIYYELFDNDEENDIVRTADGQEYAVIDGVTRGDRTAFLVGVTDKQLFYVGQDPGAESDGMEISSIHADAVELTEPVIFVRKDAELCQKLKAEIGEIEFADEPRDFDEEDTD